MHACQEIGPGYVNIISLFAIIYSTSSQATYLLGLSELCIPVTGDQKMQRQTGLS